MHALRIYIHHAPVTWHVMQSLMACYRIEKSNKSQKHTAQCTKREEKTNLFAAIMQLQWPKVREAISPNWPPLTLTSDKSRLVLISTPLCTRESAREEHYMHTINNNNTLFPISRALPRLSFVQATCDAILFAPASALLLNIVILKALRHDDEFSWPVSHRHHYPAIKRFFHPTPRCRFSFRCVCRECAKRRIPVNQHSSDCGMSPARDEY